MRIVVQAIAVSAVALAFGALSPAQAQNTSPAAEDTTGEIVVTAQRRAENVQDVPIAVSVVGGDTLNAVNAIGTQDLPSIVPSLSFSSGTELRDNSIRIRGVGTDVFTPGIEASVSSVVDGVVFAQQGSFFSDLGDLERVEILRGPQGTLFGKNASAGVVSFITKKPNFDRFEVQGNLLVAENNEYRINGVVSGPLSERTAVRLAAFYRNNDGVVRDVNTGDTYNDVEAYGFRGKLQYKATEGFDLTFSVDAQKFDSNCCALPTRIASTNPIVPITGLPGGPGNNRVALGGNPRGIFAKQTNWGFGVTADIELGEHTLSYIGAYREWEGEGDFDIDQTPAAIVTSNYNFNNAIQDSHELRLASPVYDMVDYVFGLFYFNQSQRQTLDRRGTRINLITGFLPNGQPVAPAGSELVLVSDSTVKARNISAYGQVNFRPMEKLTLTAGARVISEDQDVFFVRPLPSPFFGLGVFGPITDEYSDGAVIVKLAGRYELTDDIGAYVSYSTGYKSEGIFNSPAVSPTVFAQQPLDAETSRLWEVGLRTQFFDRKLTLNLTGFWTKFKNYQQQAFDPGLGIFLVTNAGDVHTNGVELEVTANPTSNFTFSGGVTYLDAGYDFNTGPCYPGQTAALGCVSGRQDLRLGNFVNAPKWRYTLLARYTQPISDSADIFGQVNYRWQDDVQFAYNQDPRFIQPSYGIADFKIGANFDNERFSISAFVKNAFDKQYVANINGQSGSGGGAITQSIPRDYSRYFGGELSVRF